jgi:hypothetical protein
MGLTSVNDCWNEIRSRLTPNARVCHWSVTGRAKGEFEIQEVTPDEIVLRTHSGTIRKVPRKSFEVIFPLWQEYKSGRAQRIELTEESYNSTYVVSVLHWLEEQAE